MVVPLLLATAVLLWRRSPWGYLLTSISLTHGFMMFISIPTWIAVPLIQAGQINLIEAIPLVVVALAGLALVGMFYRNVQAAKAA